MGEINLDNTGSGGAVTLSSDGTSLLLDGTAIGGGGGGADLYAANEVSVTAQPSATGDDAVAIGDSAVSSGNNSIAIGFSSLASGGNTISLGNGEANNSNAVAIGGGSLSSGVQSIAVGHSSVSTGSYSHATTLSRASGSSSFAAAIASNSASYGATGANSVAIGYQAKATSGNSFAIGDRAVASGPTSLALNSRSTASGSNSIAMGLLSDATGSGSIAIGNGYSFNGAQATFYNAIAIGQGSLSDKIGKLAVSGSAFSASGDSQHGIFVLRVATTNNTATALITGTDTLGSATPDTENQIVLPNNSAYSFSGTIIAREDATDGSDYASWEIKGALLRDANAASTVLGNGIQNKLYATAGASAWAIALTADTTNGGLKIEVTGAASTNIRWVATVHTSEVTYA